ncbi:TPA: hypothetical protein DCE37_25730 [Candidatus Latescibacteria bacterium]|nr:hypothetical protein [Candidatus Latescibacterota bacterium]
MSIVGFCLGLLLGAIPVVGEMLASRGVSTDLDRDGKYELIVGGVVANGRGLIRVGQIHNRSVRLVSELPVEVEVRDVATGDIDGDGMPEILTIGAGHLRAYRIEMGEPVALTGRRLRTAWTDRLSSLTVSDGVWIASTDYRVERDQDVGETKITGWVATDGQIEQMWSIDIDAHVGDLVLVSKGDDVFLVLESGTGDEGGDIRVYNVTGHPRQVWTHRLTDGVRCRALEVTEGNRVAIQPYGGSGSLWQVKGGGDLRRERSLQLSPLGSIVPRVGPDGHPGTLGITAEPMWAVRTISF